MAGGKVTAPTLEQEHWVVYTDLEHDALRSDLEAQAACVGMFPEVAFAPLGAVNDACIDRAGAQRGKGRGGRIVLLRAEDLISIASLAELAAPAASHKPDSEEDLTCYTLPNQMEIFHLKAYETRYLYDEVFLQKNYVKNGIELRDGDVVFDIGANIGLFSLFVSQRCKGSRIFAFEPSPVTFQVLRANLERHVPDAIALPVGIDDRDRSGDFTFYPHSSVFSGFHPDERGQAALRAIITSELGAHEKLRGLDISEHVEAILQRRFERQTYHCQLRSLSSLIREYGIERIDLLKIDAEKCEEAILAGIEPDDWSRIRQIAVELDERDESVGARVRDLLARKGFTVSLAGEPMLCDSGRCNIYGRRADGAGRNATRRHEATMQQGIRVLTRICSRTALTSREQLIVMICPSSAGFIASMPSGFPAAIEQRLAQALRAYPHVLVRETDGSGRSAGRSVDRTARRGGDDSGVTDRDPKHGGKALLDALHATNWNAASVTRNEEIA
ncbi:methyltransferase, FkbM family [Paraburkholderia phenazinium]|uniref:Methyltransferase, FkbM family n=1 Tax=Paraburkholderia phenazinium TaxID=60549 RepID=A0A1G7YYQ7_9BURK|nr:methyltransferase, FkbM family [Paraburkholderia phenazinium]